MANGWVAHTICRTAVHDSALSGGLGALLPPGMFGEYFSEVEQADKALSYTIQFVYLRGVDGQVSQMQSHDYNY